MNLHLLGCCFVVALKYKLQIYFVQLQVHDKLLFSLTAANTMFSLWLVLHKSYRDYNKEEGRALYSTFMLTVKILALEDRANLHPSLCSVHPVLQLYLTYLPSFLFTPTAMYAYAMRNFSTLQS